MMNIALIDARAHRAGGVAMLAMGHRSAWQAAPTFLVETFGMTYKHNPKGNLAWRPPSA